MIEKLFKRGRKGTDFNRRYAEENIVQAASHNKITINQEGDKRPPPSPPSLLGRYDDNG